MLRGRLRRNTKRLMSRAVTNGFSCSQTLTTFQPIFDKREFVSRSRFLLASIFLCHQSAFLFGQVPCLGQPCQKHPSTKTATFALANAISTERVVPGTRQECVLKRSPRRWSRERRVLSPALSLPEVAAILRLTEGVVFGSRFAIHAYSTFLRVNPNLSFRGAMDRRTQTLYLRCCLCFLILPG